MITQTDNENRLQNHAEFIGKVNEYKALLTANKLPFSIDLDTLNTAYRTHLFAELLSIDKGLKMRWDMLKTDAARLALVTATVDLDGYELVAEYSARLADLQSYFKGHNSVTLDRADTFEEFYQVYQLDLPTYLARHTISWQGKEEARAYFEALIPTLEALTRIMHPNGGAGSGKTGLREALTTLTHLYECDAYTVRGIDELKLWALLNPALGYLANVPVLPAAGE